VKPMRRLCVMCGIAFDPYTGRALYCSRPCAMQRKRELEILRNPRKIFASRPCQVCHSKFQPRDHRQIVCSEACYSVRKSDLQRCRTSVRIWDCAICRKRYHPVKNSNCCSVQCRKEWRRLNHRRQYEENREAVKAQHAAYRREHKDYYRQKSKEWAEANPDRIRDSARKSEWKHREKRLQKTRDSEAALALCKKLNVPMPNASRSQQRHAAYMALRDLGIISKPEIVQ
jgi:hypothetical protein